MSTSRRVLGGALAVLVGVASALVMAAPAHADGGPHRSRAVNTETSGGAIKVDSTLGFNRCASCHRAHTAQSSYLLKEDDQTMLCYSCHGDANAGSRTNVQSGTKVGTGADGLPALLALRGGGFERAMLGATEAYKDMYLYTYPDGRTTYRSKDQVIPALTAPEPVTSSHFSDLTTKTIWGSGPLTDQPFAGEEMTAGTKLECGSCHDPHGNGNYRILKPLPDAAAPGTAGVTVPDTGTRVYTTTNYWVAADQNHSVKTTQRLQATSYLDPTPIVKTGGEVDAYIANVAAWCTTCHTRYLAPSGSWEKNSGDAIYTYRHTGDHIGTNGLSSRNCIQCHVAHGSNAVMASNNSKVEYPGGVTPSDSSRMLRVDERGICLMCHNV